MNKISKSIVISAIFLITIGTILLASSNFSQSTTLFRKHSKSSNLKGSDNLFALEKQAGVLNKAQKCIQKETVNQGCGAYASEDAADDLEVINDYQRNFASSAKDVIEYADKCFKKSNPNFWQCMDSVYTTCVTDKDNAAQAQKDNVGLQNFYELAPELYKEDCVCKMKYTDIPNKQALVLKIANNNDYIDVKADLNNLAKNSEYFQCVNEQFEVIPQFNEKTFGNINKVCDTQFSTRIKQQDRLNLHSLIKFSNGKNVGYTEIRQEILKQKYTEGSDYFQCLLKKVDNNLPVAKYASPLFAKLNNEKCDKLLDITQDLTGETKLLIIDLAAQSKKFTTYDQYNDALVAEKMDTRSQYYQCLETTLFENWQFVQLTEKSFKPLNGKCDKKFKSISEQEQFNHFYEQINKNKVNTYLELNKEFLDFKFNTQLDSFKCYQEQIFENYPVETFSETKLFGTLNKNVASKCKKLFVDTPEKQSYNAFVELVNKQKKQAWPTLNDQLDQNANTFNSNSKFFQCFWDDVDALYPVETLSNKTFAKLNGQCDKKFKRADEKEVFNTFIESVNSNKKVAQFEDLNDQFVNDKTLNKGADYYECFAEQINKSWVFEQFADKSYKPLNGVCDKKFESTEDKEAYNKFVVQVNSSKKSDYLSLQSAFEQYKFNTKSDFYPCVQEAILKNYPVEKFTAKNFAGFSQKCSKTFDTVKEKQAFNDFVEKVNKDKKITDLDQLLDYFKSTRPDDQVAYVQCFEQVMLDSYPLTKFSNKDFGVLNGKCEKEFTTVNQKKTFNSFVDTINKSDKTWEAFYADFKKESSFFETKSKEYSCFQKEIFNDYPVYPYTNKNLVKEFGSSKCLKNDQFTSVEDKQTYNNFVNSVNKNSKITDLESYYPEFKGNKDFQNNKQKYISCLSQQIFDDFPITQYSDKTLAKEFNTSACVKSNQFSSTDAKLQYDQFVEGINKNSKVNDLRTFNAQLQGNKDFKNSKEKFLSCLNTDINKNYPISQFADKTIGAQLNGKCDKKFTSVEEKESYDVFVDAANKAKTAKWADLNTLFTKQKFDKTQDKDILSCVQPIINTNVAAEKKSAKPAAKPAAKKPAGKKL